MLMLTAYIEIDATDRDAVRAALPVVIPGG